jgi:chemotaxis protein MotB
MARMTGRLWVRRGAALGGLVLAAVIGAGCQSAGHADLLRQENEELRARLAESERARSDLESLNLAMSRQLDQAGSTADATGFEGIDGVGVSRSGGEIVVGIAGDVLFASGSADLRPEAKRSLDKVASVLKSRYNGQIVRVEGYTDTDPIRKSKWKSNEHLSAERALAVENYLVSKGVPNERIYSAAFGPAGQKSTKAQSRRVEIVILASGG